MSEWLDKLGGEDKLIELYETKPVREIAGMAGVSHQTICTKLVDLGVELRGRGKRSIIDTLPIKLEEKGYESINDFLEREGTKSLQAQADILGISCKALSKYFTSLKAG